MKTRLADTNLWFKSYLLHRDARFTYELGPSDQPTNQGGQGWDPNLAAWQQDPLNPRSCSFPHDNEGAFAGYTASLLTLPDAPPQPWLEVHDNIVPGRTELHHYYTLSGSTRSISAILRPHRLYSKAS